jgi:hypothetical protein
VALWEDRIFGGFGQGGVDHVFGGDGNDAIAVDQRGVKGVKPTKEVVDCGAGNDTVYRDKKDVIATTASIKRVASRNK